MSQFIMNPMQIFLEFDLKTKHSYWTVGLSTLSLFWEFAKYKKIHSYKSNHHNKIIILAVLHRYV